MEHQQQREVKQATQTGTSRLLSKAMADIEHQRERDIMDYWERTVFKKKRQSIGTPKAVTPTQKPAVIV
jgi:hypothetical protein